MNRRQALIEIAKQQGIEPSIIAVAFSENAPEAIEIVFSQIDAADNAAYLIPKFTEEFLLNPVNPDTFVELATILLQRPNHSGPRIAKLLTDLADSRAEELLRQMLDLSWVYPPNRPAAARALISRLYADDAQHALSDQSEFVRLKAAQRCEQEANTEALIHALTDDSAAVRRIAAWYMGRKQVMTAVPTLIFAARQEEDLETLRAIVWSLGILDSSAARSLLNDLISHGNPQIVTAAKEALVRLDQPITKN